jgi:hypothetical protein
MRDEIWERFAGGIVGLLPRDNETGPLLLFTDLPLTQTNLDLLASHGTPWRHTKILHRCDTRTHCRSGRSQKRVGQDAHRRL